MCNSIFKDGNCLGVIFSALLKVSTTYTTYTHQHTFSGKERKKERKKKRK
jgi:hypothetical protein